MADDEEEKLRRQLEQLRQQDERNAKKRMRIGAKLSATARTKQERRKYLAGAWALDRAERDPKFRQAMIDGLNNVWLVHERDRMLWELPPLPDDVKAARLASFEEKRKTRRDRKPPPEPEPETEPPPETDA